ncbi:hypothetical protein VBZ67_03860 [Campylobacter concisus]
MEHVSFGECIDVFTHLNISKAMYVTKDKNGKEHKEDVTHLEIYAKRRREIKQHRFKVRGAI